MTTKLTLSLNQEIIIQAKSYALQTGRSLSELVENYFETLSSDVYQNNELSPKLKKIAGSIKIPEDFDEKKELESYYDAKYL